MLLPSTLKQLKPWLWQSSLLVIRWPKINVPDWCARGPGLNSRIWQKILCLHFCFVKTVVTGYKGIEICTDLASFKCLYLTFSRVDSCWTMKLAKNIVFWSYFYYWKCRTVKLNYAAIQNIFAYMLSNSWSELN